ncbi:hypothetical protein AN958_08625 [Leucoagaricus sp. SymC.cos]|nr:hypothetical protein AN958_08625 [Leucoagaricus sp. SymC.cos]
MWQSPHKNHFVLVGPIWVVCNSKVLDTVTAYFEVWDSQRGTHAANLMSHSLQFGHWTSQILEANANPGASLCQHCWTWGHSSQSCHAKAPQCPLCGRPHYQDSHCAFAGCCKRNPCQDIPKTPEGQPCSYPSCCLNCHQAHTATLKQCPFWCHQFDKDWLCSKYQEVHSHCDTHASKSNHSPSHV